MRSAALRKQEKADEALKLIEENLPRFEDEVVGRIEAIKAALQIGNVAVAKIHARELEKTDPDMPIVRHTLDNF
jgi:hypothetical protein